MTTLLSAVSSMAREYDIYFGTYTSCGFSKGIYHALFDADAGALSDLELACELSKPSFLAIHPNGKFIYSVTEGDPGKVSSLRIDKKTKKLELINHSESGGRGPCHLVVSGNGKNLYVANYASGSVAAIAINDDGSLGKTVSNIQHVGSGPNKRRQKGPHAHSVNLSPDNRFAYVADLGMDKVMIYKVDPVDGALLKNETSFFALPPGAGPRHFTFHPNGKFAYLINELGNTIVALSYDAKNGGLREIQTISTLPKDFDGVSHTAEVSVHPNGKFLYGSNRGHDSIAVYKIDQNNGSLTLAGFQGKGIDEPRHFNIDPTGRYCVVGNQDANDVVLFKVNLETGELIPTEVRKLVGKPICVKFLKR
ncbi:MAG: lactonase family protein [Victivallales bacterium]|nr:lactonase family protein [Victivallales bacterium]